MIPRISVKLIKVSGINFLGKSRYGQIRKYEIKAAFETYTKKIRTQAESKRKEKDLQCKYQPKNIGRASIPNKTKLKQRLVNFL